LSIQCEIVSQDRQVFSGIADIVILPGANGVMGILEHHSPLLTTLKYGIITVRRGDEEQIFTVAGGFAEVQPDQVTVLADAAEDIAEIDIQRAEEARKRAQELLERGVGADTDQYLAIQAALRRSTLRLNAARKYGKRQQR
jgi:F-type H+-transporting ATPase subunit epsilon